MKAEVKAEALRLQGLFQRHRRLKYPAVLTAVLIGLNLFLYYGLVFPNQEKRMVAEQAWRQAREEFSLMQRHQKAQEDLSRFRKLLLTKNEFTKQVNHLSDTAKRLDLNLPSVSYKPDSLQQEQLTKVNFSFKVIGRYEAIRRFIHAIETSSDFLIIEDLVLDQRAKGAGPLELQLKLATYLR